MESRNPNEVLVLAAKSGNMAELNLALKNGAYINHALHNTFTAIEIALKKNHTEIVIRLLEKSALLNLQDETMRKLLASHLRQCQNPENLLNLFAALAKCGLKDDLLINLLPREYKEFKNQNLKKEIIAYLRALPDLEERIYCCQKALNPYDPIGYIVHMMHKPKDFGQSKATVIAVEKIVADALDALKPKPSSNQKNAVEMVDIVKKDKPAEEDEYADVVVVDDGTYPILNNDGSVKPREKILSIFDLIRQDELVKVETLIADEYAGYPELLNRAHAKFDTPLYLAIQLGHADIAILLLNKGASLSAGNACSYKLRNAYLNTKILAALFSKYPDKNEMKAFLLLAMCSKIYCETNGKLVFEWFEIMAKYFNPKQIEKAIKSQGCQTKTKEAVVEALDKTEDKKLFIMRYEMIMNKQHPLGAFLRTNGNFLNSVDIRDLMEPFKDIYDSYKEILAAKPSQGGLFAPAVNGQNNNIQIAVDVETFEMEDFEGSPELK